MADQFDLGDLDDPIGEASIRLLAAGVPSSDRLGAVMFLGLLHDHAHANGRLRSDPFDVAAEFGIPVRDAERFLGWLTDAAAVGHLGGTWWVSRHEPMHGAAVPHALGLSMLADPGGVQVQAPRAARSRSTLPAAVAAVAMVAMGIAGVLRTTAPVAPAAVETVAIGAPAAPADTAIPGALTTPAPSAIPAPGTSAPGLPAVGTGSAPAAIAATAACPALAPPLATIAGIDGTPAVIHGAVRNDAARAVMVHAVDLVLGSNGVVVPALSTPLRLEPGSALAFDVPLPPGADPAGVTAVVRDFAYDAC